MSLDKFRSQIDDLDEKIVKLLNQRIKVVQEIGKTKKNSGDEIYVPQEKELFLKKLQN